MESGGVIIRRCGVKSVPASFEDGMRRAEAQQRTMPAVKEQD